MSQVEKKVREHFHADAERFDAIYEEKKSIVARVIDNWWRGVVRKRLELSIEALEPLRDKRILDVGCGSGRFCIAFAEKGAKEVTGIDFAEGMIDIASTLAKKANLESICNFYVGNFPDDLPDGKFDGCTANGFFDYIENPTPLIAKMREITNGKLIMSFPKAIEWRVPLRWVRFQMKGTPLFLYKEAKVKNILREASIKNYKWVNLDRDYFIVANV